MATVPDFDPAAVAEVGERLRANIREAVKVGDGVVRDVLVALFAEGHVLIEDYPGVGKTALARALARSIDAEYARVQCTADLLPSDIVGTNVFNQRETPLRVPPRAGLRERRPRRRDQPQLAEDPVGPARVHAGAPRHRSTATSTSSRGRSWWSRPRTRPSTRAPTRCPRPSSTASWSACRSATRRRRRGGDARASTPLTTGFTTSTRSPTSPPCAPRSRRSSAVHGSEALRRYVVALGEATRNDTRVELGASPRATLMLFRAAKALAALDGRDHVLPDDVQALAPAVLAHRLLLAPEAAQGDATSVIADALERVPAL